MSPQASEVLEHMLAEVAPRNDQWEATVEGHVSLDVTTMPQFLRRPLSYIDLHQLVAVPAGVKMVTSIDSRSIASDGHEPPCLEV